MGDAWDGRPQNPERGGWHWVWMPDCAGHRPAVPIWWTNCSWEHPLVECGHPLFDGLMDPADVPADWRYLGPCLTPDEVAAREAADISAVLEALGIPAATLHGLREKRLVAVPVEPTEAMIGAGAASNDYPSVFMGGPSHNGRDKARRIWAAMLAAAQEPPQ